MRTETCNFNFLLRRSYETSQNIKILFCSTTSVRFILYQGFSTKFSGWPVVLWLTSGSPFWQWFHPQVACALWLSMNGCKLTINSSIDFSPCFLRSLENSERNWKIVVWGLNGSSTFIAHTNRWWANRGLRCRRDGPERPKKDGLARNKRSALTCQAKSFVFLVTAIGGRPKS